ncbi:hypothetical protein K449DRAFT_402772 [Hypoxylon sp. EC38]|nr:hypothetical protein K449DRAFT_402772 [Hypoxylon sp. EC38]
MYSPMPTYSYNKEPQHKAARDGASLAPEIDYHSTTSSSTAPVYQLHHSIDDLLEPAIEGPPSPERIRAFSNQMKRRSSADKHHSEITTSSGSSRHSATSDRRPSWNQSLESLSLSRNPSQRSTSSGAPSRDRPDSVQFFGKGIFNRGRAKLRRGSSDQNSSNSSLDASEMPIEAMPPPKEQPFISSVFARRRALRGEATASSQKKLQISGPYNFQHLTHTRKDSVPNLDRTNRMELVSEFSSMRPRRPTDASLHSVAPEEPQFPRFSDPFFHQEDPSAGLNANVARSRNNELPSLPPPPPPPPMRYAKRSQSQDKIRIAPPRPPRSPAEDGFVPPIPPPPRTSSRVSIRHNRLDSLSGTLTERPATSTGFRKPEPFVPISPKGLRPPPAPRAEPVVESNQESIAAPLNFGHAITTPDEAAWPLSNSITSLPDVPEEEEHHAVTRPSRMSVTSNQSSLRGSVSVPLLRQLSLTQSPQRPPSNASDTLGFFNAQRLTRTGTGDESLADDGRDNWEDDIDYCYEHEAEADCDYAWERPSCDIVRGSDIPGARTMGDQTETIITFGGLSRGLLSPESSDVPALSPASQTSNVDKQEAVTPTNLPVTSNFSLPRRESSAHLLRAHKPTQSIETSFRESQGFSLSPSLLIPNDYHQQMLQYEREDLQDSDDEDFLIQTNAIDEPIIKFGKSLKPSNIRSSASTTDSALSEHSLASSRHKSTASTSTAYTRWTGSSTSSWTARDSSQPVPPKPVIENTLPAIASPTDSVTIPIFDEEIFIRQDVNREKHSRTHSHADLLMRTNYDAAPPVEPKTVPSKEPLKTRRRARTTSRSHASPQFALFPSVTTATYGGRV